LLLLGDIEHLRHILCGIAHTYHGIGINNLPQFRIGITPHGCTAGYGLLYERIHVCSGGEERDGEVRTALIAPADSDVFQSEFDSHDAELSACHA
jgi:hypothetical protein